MYNIHFKPEVDTLRVFKDGSYSHRSEPITSCTIHYLGDNKVYISNLRGEVNRIMFRLIFENLYSKGVRLAEYERNKENIKVNLDKYFKELVIPL